MQPPSNRLTFLEPIKHPPMKTTIKRLTTGAVALSAVLLSALDTRAADVRLEGYGDYVINDSEAFFPRPPKQSGRYRDLGRDYYHKAEIRMDYVSNLSRSGSGSLSFELWAMPYYDATSGIVLLTRAINPIRGGRSVDGASGSGYAVSLGKKRFPELSLWEYTRKGWINRDHLTFDYKDYL